ncbi:uncharacterized protein LOC142893097 isoform X1 [Nelusetta ayraudi]|uniref:uncharacterized protein LOC142893097 isoform X1 n=1 Tax=Nelusetta ayraudi TaxID=303726 RepID=UPI003F70CFC2
MLANEIQFLRRLAFLVVCHDLTAGHVVPELTLLPRAMSWPEARHFCQRHYVDLAVLSSDEQYRALLNATAGSAAMFWVGLRLHSGVRDWRWVSGEELGYDRWFRKSPSGRCASFEATLQDERRLLSRYCDEWHMFVCQGPLPPHQVTMDSVSGADRVVLSWRIAAFMQMTPHTYNVTRCSDTCETLLFPYDGGGGAASMNVSISGLSLATPTSIQISSSVVRTDSLTGRNTTLQSRPIVFQVRAAADPEVEPSLIIIILKSPKPLYLGLLLWLLYCVLKKCDFFMEPRDMMLSPKDTVVQLMVPDNQCSLLLHQTPAAA